MPTTISTSGATHTSNRCEAQLTRSFQMRGAFAAFVTASVALVAPAPAQDVWPQRQVTIVVPFAAGGSADLLGRILAQHMQVKYGVPFVVENRSGAGGSIGAGYVAKAANDGLTLLLGTIS